MAKRTNHVVPSSTGWVVKKSGAKKASRIFDEKAQAVAYAKKLSRLEATELYIHGKNGMIIDKSSYGKDPQLPKAR